MRKVFDHILQQLSKKYNETIVLNNCEQVHGGDINSNFIMNTTAGNFFIKLNDAGYNDMFEKEAEGLKLLASANAIKVPRPILHGCFETDIFLVMEAVIKGNKGKDFWKEFAYALAVVHQQTASFFGLDESNYIGSLPQSNKKHNNWSSFYAEERIMPLMQKVFAKKNVRLMI